MGLQLSTTSIHKALKAANSARAQLANVRQKGEALTDRAVRTVESFGSAFVIGMTQGAGVFKNGEIFKIPVELAAGLLLHGVSLLGLGGKHGDHLANFGDGALSAYGNILGRGVGAQQWGASKTAGEMSGDLADRLEQISAAA